MLMIESHIIGLGMHCHHSANYLVHCRLPGKEQESGPFFSKTEGILNLSKAKESDSGIYTCVATNSFGSASESTTITIVQERGDQ